MGHDQAVSLAITSLFRTRAPASAPVRQLFHAAGRPVPTRSELKSALHAPDVHPAISEGAERLIGEAEAFPRFADHEAINRGGDAAERLAFFQVCRLLAPQVQAARERLLDALPRDASPLDDLRIDRSSGVLVTDQSAWAPVAEAVEEARACFAVEARSDAINPGKRFMTTAKLPRALDSRIMALARHPAVLRLIGRYLGGLPILYRINLLDSANDEVQPDSSQFFHLDPEDFRQLKIFLLAEDVDEDAGPLHLLSAAASDEVRLAFGHRHGRLGDAEVMARTSPAALIRCTGPAGTLAIGDTSRCFHFGSRPGRRRRWVVMIQYLTPFASAFPIDARAASSKYAEAVRQRAAKAGQTIEELDARLYGLSR